MKWEMYFCALKMRENAQHAAAQRESWAGPTFTAQKQRAKQTTTAAVATPHAEYVKR